MFIMVIALKPIRRKKGIRPLYWDVLSEESAATERGLIYVLTTEGVSELDMKTETFTHISDKQKEWMTAITYCDGKLFMGTYGRIYEGRKQPEYKRPIVTFRDRYCLIVC